VCSPGTSIDLSARATGAIGEWVNVPDVPIVLHGSAYSTVYFSGDLSFDAPTVPAPAITSSSLQVVDLVAPFLFTGQLTAFATADRTGNALFHVMLTGRGDTDTIISTAGAGHSWLVEGVDFRFASADVSPTPEPATVTLVAAGVLAAAASRRRRARHQRVAA
jgi:MYXO-CTERM domain-containing protein